MDNNRFFKSWAKPGPPAPGAGTGVPGPGETLDAISGDWRIFQLKKGHRFSTDDLLTAYYGTCWCPSARTILDLGSGVGTVGMIAAWRLPGARLVAVEAQEESVVLAKNPRVTMAWRRAAKFAPAISGTRPSCAKTKNSISCSAACPISRWTPECMAITRKNRLPLRGARGHRRLLPDGGAASGLGRIVCLCFSRAASGAAGSRDGGGAGGGVGHHPLASGDLERREPPLLGLFAMSPAEHLPEWFRGQTWMEPALVIRTQGGEVHPEYQALKLSIGFPP